MASTVLNEAQMSILRLLGSMKTVEEVDELRQVICDYYARRVDEEVDKLWESGQWDNEKNEAVLKEHFALHTSMPSRKIVLDTNCLISSLSRRGQYYPVWKGLQAGEYVLCVSTEILEEYAEIITQKMSVEVAANVIHLLLESKFVELIDPYFRLHLIEADHDDNKFVDCAFAANATYIVSDDKHYDVLKEVDFPQILVLKLKEFLGLLQSDENRE